MRRKTSPWEDHWFLNLSPGAKLLYLFVEANCDAGGVWLRDEREAEHQIGTKLDWVTVVDELCRNPFSSIDRLFIFDGGRKWWLVDYIPERYPRLNGKHGPQMPAYRSLQRHGLLGTLAHYYPNFEVECRQVQMLAGEVQKQKAAERRSPTGLPTALMEIDTQISELMFHQEYDPVLKRMALSPRARKSIEVLQRRREKLQKEANKYAPAPSDSAPAAEANS